MRGKDGRGGRGVTLGDALSAEMQIKMNRLRKDLEIRARSAIQAQLKQPTPPWKRTADRPPRPPVVTIAPKAPSDGPKLTILRGSEHAIWPATKVSVGNDAPRAGPARESKPITVEVPKPADPPPPPFRFWELPPEAAVREPPPHAITAGERDEVQRAMGGAVTPATGDQPLFVTIGLDFGTSSTKVIARLP